jgi:hypothetical protein
MCISFIGPDTNKIHYDYSQLYNVNSVDGEIDEVDIAAGHTMVDYLLSLLTEKKPNQKEERSSDEEEEEEGEERMRKVGQSMNGEETLKWVEPPGGESVNGGEALKWAEPPGDENVNGEEALKWAEPAGGESVNGKEASKWAEPPGGENVNGEEALKWAEPPADESVEVNRTNQKNNVCDKMESNKNVEEQLRNCVRENVALNDTVTDNNSYSDIKTNGPEMMGEHCNIDKSETEKCEEDLKLSDAEDMVEEKHNLSELIKMSYDITVPYDTCSVMGEDLLRGYLQNMDYDCIITVSDVHFKAHR